MRNGATVNGVLGMASASGGVAAATVNVISCCGDVCVPSQEEAGGKPPPEVVDSDVWFESVLVRGVGKETLKSD
jgi:hypothetical protein